MTVIMDDKIRACKTFMTEAQQKDDNMPDIIKNGIVNQDTVDSIHESTNFWIDKSMKFINKTKKIPGYYLKQKILPKSNVGVLHDATFDQAREEHEHRMKEINK